jgi:hypothetical protein
MLYKEYSLNINKLFFNKIIALPLAPALIFKLTKERGDKNICLEV